MLVDAVVPQLFRCALYLKKFMLCKAKWRHDHSGGGVQQFVTTTYQWCENIEKSCSRPMFNVNGVSLVSHRPTPETNDGLVPSRFRCRVPGRIFQCQLLVARPGQGRVEVAQVKRSSCAVGHARPGFWATAGKISDRPWKEIVKIEKILF